MGKVTTLNATVTPLRARDYSSRQLALIQRTVAADCNKDEFDLFVEVSRRVGLDPFRRQIYAAVYNKDKPDKRKMSIITGIDGFRAVAGRNRDYRPDENEPVFTIDADTKGPANPAGLVKVVVRCFKYGPDEQWHPIAGVAYWHEFAPVKETGPDSNYEWIDTGEVWPDSGKPKKRKQLKAGATAVPAVDGKWATMPHVMLAKCAEAQALRRGWPEDLSGVYAPEEMARAEVVDLTASEAVEQFEATERRKLVGSSGAIAFMWEAGAPLEMVPVGKLADRCLAFIAKAESPTQLEAWRDTNRVGLQSFWAESKGDAHAVKKALEDRLAALTKE